MSVLTEEEKERIRKEVLKKQEEDRKKTESEQKELKKTSQKKRAGEDTIYFTRILIPLAVLFAIIIVLNVPGVVPFLQEIIKLLLP